MTSPEREQAEALSDAREFLSWIEEQRAGEYHEHLGDAYREMVRVYRAFVAAVERAEKAEAKAEGVQWGDLSASITERERADAAVERERELTRALGVIAAFIESRHKEGDTDYQAAIVAREALAGGVSAAPSVEGHIHMDGVRVGSDGVTGWVRPIDGNLLHIRNCEFGGEAPPQGERVSFTLSPNQEVVPAVPEVLPEYDDDPASISREMCPPEVLPEERCPNC